MKNLTLFGKVNLALGIISLILGIYLFVETYTGGFVFKEQYLSISFVALGISLFFASYLTKEEKE
ncbi:hypothetical protein [Oceanobacillus manasiensis]|uniref:hypothetical protein n=1 Tax=Oceanobacillus manasiensis TaxID=586413 RepID=UPI0005AA3C64|nr:hypothetical protein [Oceanobacillus manasiensis]